jgi:hypothetical protein
MKDLADANEECEDLADVKYDFSLIWLREIEGRREKGEKAVRVCEWACWREGGEIWLREVFKVRGKR